MKRPIVNIMLSFIAGIFMAASTNSLFILLLIEITSIFIVATIIFIKRRYAFIAICILFFFTFGASEFIYMDHRNSGIFRGYYGQNVKVEGFMAAEANLGNGKISYIVKTQSITSEKGKAAVKGKVKVTLLADDKTEILKYGQSVTINMVLDEPAADRNPGGFDYRRYLAGKGIQGTALCQYYDIGNGTAFHGNPAVKLGLKLRDHIVNIINRSLPAQQAGLLNGMLIGYREGLDEEVEKAFSDAGLVHIMAVSGANIAFIMLPFVFIFKKMRIGRNLSNILIINILVLFAFITGFSASVLRAVIMAVIVLTGQIIKRENDVIAGLSAAAIILAVANPYIIFDIGFQLSFSATLALILFYNNINNMLKIKHVPEGITGTLAVTLAAQAGVLPVSTYYFNNISLIAPLSNLLAAPLLEIITILGSFMALLGTASIALSNLLGYVNCFFLSVLLYITKVTSSFSFSVVKVITPNIALIILYYIMVVLLFWYAPKMHIRLKLVHILTACCIILLAFFTTSLMPKSLDVVFIDVGQGDSIFIRTSRGKTLLIDGGGKSSGYGESSSGEKAVGFDTGSDIVIPFLLDYGVSKLDMVIATHAHDDHIQGLLTLLDEFKTDKFVYSSSPENNYDNALSICKKKGISYYSCQKGDIIKIDSKTRIEIYYPEKNIEQLQTSSNNESIVLKLVYGKTSMLFTGDIENAAEAELLKEGSNIKSQVLKVAHHGSDSSTTAAFLEEVDPDVAIICVGKNSFGHPSPEILNRLQENDIRTFRTDKDGAIMISSNGRTLNIKTNIMELP